ncbi:MAG TPA: hypothetical protein VGB76_12745 [Pyrinomonadaceae bacterium]
MKIGTHCLSFVVAACVLSGGQWVFSQTVNNEPRFVTLQARRKTDVQDNYVEAAFSFEHGVNGKEALRITHNDWDLLFGNSFVADTFDVTMVTDDCSRIKDLGEFGWYDSFKVPVLPAHDKPTREPSVRAVVGHMYVVHTKDRETDLYALFRVEALEPGTSVTISWKRVPPPENEPQDTNSPPAGRENF